MSRSGYCDDYTEAEGYLYRANVDRAIRGKRGQKFLYELLAEMDAMPVKELVHDELEKDGAVCAIGLMTRKRGLNVTWSDETGIDNAAYVAHKLNIAECLAREIVFENDEDWSWWRGATDTPADRWYRMRRWVISHLNKGEER